MDETRAPVLDPELRGRTKTGWLWALARDDRNWGGADPPGVVYFYAPSRGGQHAERFLDGFEGILQVDGYAGYTRLVRTRPRVRHQAYCWSHARRKLRDVFESSGSKVAAEGLSPDRRVLRPARPTSAVLRPNGASPSARRGPYRWSRTSASGSRTNAPAPQPSPASARPWPISPRYWDGLRLFLEDGRVELDTGAVENRIRPQEL